MLGALWKLNVVDIEMTLKAVCDEVRSSRVVPIYDELQGLLSPAKCSGMEMLTECLLSLRF